MHPDDGRQLLVPCRPEDIEATVGRGDVVRLVDDLDEIARHVLAPGPHSCGRHPGRRRRGSPGRTGHGVTRAATATAPTAAAAPSADRARGTQCPITDATHGGESSPRSPELLATRRVGGRERRPLDGWEAAKRGHSTGRGGGCRSVAGQDRGMQLSDVVATSHAVAATASRTAKVEALAACLRRAAARRPRRRSRSSRRTCRACCRSGASASAGAGSRACPSPPRRVEPDRRGGRRRRDPHRAHHRVSGSASSPVGRRARALRPGHRRGAGVAARAHHRRDPSGRRRRRHAPGDRQGGRGARRRRAPRRHARRLRGPGRAGRPHRRGRRPRRPDARGRPPAAADARRLGPRRRRGPRHAGRRGRRRDQARRHTAAGPRRQPHEPRAPCASSPARSTR